MNDIEQGTPEWFAARLGKVTASKVKDVMAQGRGNAPSASRATYMGELIAERLSGVASEGFTNGTMDHGTQTEPQARAAYTMETGNMVDEIGFVVHPTIADSGASPDGMVGADGLVEIKCPLTKTHIEFLKTGAVPSNYQKQMMWQMACTGRVWCDFVSFDPRMPHHMRLRIVRVHRDDGMIREMESAVMDFIIEMRGEIAALEGIYGVGEAA